MRKGEIIQIGNATIAHRIKSGRMDKIVWDAESGDWTVIDPEENLSDELLIKVPNPDLSVCNPLG